MLESTAAVASDTRQDITQLLTAWRGGDQAALDSLIPLIDVELRRIAKGYLRKERPDHTLQTTELLNEAYVRLIDSKRASWNDRTHFFAACAQIMRRILVDYARARSYAKRGGGAPHVSIDEIQPLSVEPRTDLVAIDEALEALSRADPRKGKVVELRFFGGLTVEETAEVLGISADSVMRDWRLARVWLMRELMSGHQEGRDKVGH